MEQKFIKQMLSGQWELCWQETGTGEPQQILRRLESEGIPCAVPGDVHAALADAGVIPEPLIDIQNEDCRWMEQQEFWYRKKFTVKKEFLQDRIELVLEGLDLTADIWLNGSFIGSHNNAFIEKIIDVTNCLKAGENELLIRIDDGVYSVRDKPLDIAKHSWNNDQPYRMWMRKPQFVYGWDWTIWMPTCGIWKDVFLRSYHKAGITDVNVHTKFEGSCITLSSTVELDICADVYFTHPGSYNLQCLVSGDPRFGDGSVAASGKCQMKADGAKREHCRVTVSLEEPRLWWPNGSGDPYLYQIALSLTDEAGNVLHRWEQRHGLRTVEIREDVLDEKSLSFTFTINGQRIFCKGANHVPADCLLGRITDEKIRNLLDMAARENMNMIRVWGGGVYESECFMDTCDALGLMVWHDFMFACGYYPDHIPEYYEEIRTEATAAIIRLRRHTSLVGWSGNNEIQEMYHSLKQWNPDHPWYGGRLYEQLLPELVQSLCPDRIYRPSSPYGGPTPDCYDQGDQHTWHFTHRPGWDHYLDLWRFTDFDFKFLSEFGIIGAMNLESAQKCIREDALDPNSPQWLHHTNTSSDHTLLNVFVDKYFGLDSVRDLQDYILKSQVIQAEIMRHIYDELRSRKFRCSGVLLWTLSDSYGIHNWSVIDYYLAKRPVYYYLKRSMAPVNLSILGYEVQNFDGMANYRAYYNGEVEPIELHLMNDSLAEKQVEAKYQVITFDGEVLMEQSQDCALDANSVLNIGSVDITPIKDSFVPEETLLYTQVWESGAPVNENHYFFAPFGKLNLRSAVITWRMQRLEENRFSLELHSDTMVWMLHMTEPEGVCFSDNDFLLLPGQTRTVILEGEWEIAQMPQMHSLNPGLTFIRKE